MFPTHSLPNPVPLLHTPSFLTRKGSVLGGLMLSSQPTTFLTHGSSSILLLKRAILYFHGDLFPSILSLHSFRISLQASPLLPLSVDEQLGNWYSVFLSAFCTCVLRSISYCCKLQKESSLSYCPFPRPLVMDHHLPIQAC